MGYAIAIAIALILFFIWLYNRGSGNAEAVAALDKLRSKIQRVQLAGEATTQDCLDIKQLITEAKDAGVSESRINDLKSTLSGLCPDL